MKIFYLFFAFVLGLLWAVAVPAAPIQATEPAAHVGASPPAADRPIWQTFTSAAGRFSVLLPSVPEAKTVVLSTVHETVQQFICRAYTGVYLVQYVDRPAEAVKMLGAEKMLSLADDAFIEENQTSAIIKRHFVLNGYPAHEIVATRSNGSKETHIVYLVGTRRYTLMTLQRSNQLKADPSASAKFLGSFALLAAKTPNRNR